VGIDNIDLGFQLEADLAAAVEAIRADASAGPIDLARRGAEVILRLTDKAYYERPLQIVLEVQGLARALLGARPDSMPLANLACEAVRPLPELYGRGKSEGARMRGDVRARIEAWLRALDERAARIEAARAEYVNVVSVRAISLDGVFVRQNEGVPDRPRYAVAGPEKFVPRNYEFGLAGLQCVSLEQWDGILSGDAEGPESIESVRKTIAALRFEPILL
jgi:hypothetical protein